MKYALALLMTGVVVLTLLFAGCTSPRPGGTAPPVSPIATPATPALSGCGFTSYHGLSLACGANPPQVCTAVYQLGDKCRQYAFCSTDGGACSLVTTPQYLTCKRCIEKCGGADPAEAFSCEEKC